MPGSERDGKLDPAGLRFQQPAATTAYTVTTFIEIRDDAEAAAVGQPPGHEQAAQQQLKSSASPTQAIIELGTDDTTGAESVRLNVDNQLPPGTGGSQQIMPRGGPGSGEQQQRVHQRRFNAQEFE